MIVFSTSGHSLRFQSHPSLADADAEISRRVGTTPPLEPDDPSNRPLLEYQQWLTTSLDTLRRMGSLGGTDLEAIRSRLMSDIEDESTRLIDLQDVEWENQIASTARSSSGIPHTAYVDTSESKSVSCTCVSVSEG